MTVDRFSVHRYQPTGEALLLLLVTLPLALWLHIPTLWFVLPFALITLTKRAYAPYGLTLANPGRIRFHLTVSTAVFGSYLLGHYLFAHWTAGMTFHLRLPPRFASAVIDQFLLVALPEEFFFRGYMQTEFDRTWSRPFTCCGARWGLGLPAAAALFAACHVIYGGPARLIVFFPGLFYGWLRERTDTILVPMSYHAVSNLLMQIVLASLSR